MFFFVTTPNLTYSFLIKFTAHKFTGKIKCVIHCYRVPYVYFDDDYSFTFKLHSEWVFV